MPASYRTPNLSNRSFARTNAQTIAQRVAVLRELLPGVKSIAEICCGDCSRQAAAYRQYLGIATYRGLDIQSEIVAANRARGIDCVCGDALDAAALRPFRAFDVIFFGPPLSADCDGHHGLSFREVVPAYADFAGLLLGDLVYDGTWVCICPNTTTLGDARWLCDQVKKLRADFELRLIRYSYSTLTGDGASTAARLKYVELWFSSRLGDGWEVRRDEPQDA
jgi:hypothetical protein